MYELRYLLDLIPFVDPTRRWPERAGGPLTLDMATGEVSGVSPRAPWDRLDRFGRPANRAPRFHGQFEYPGSGAIFSLDGGEVSMAEVHLAEFDADDEITDLSRRDGFELARLTIRTRDGQSFTPDVETTPDQVRAALGPPTHEDPDPDWFSINYDTETWALEFEFSAGGDELTAIYVIYFRPE